jgi:hypothetical protein
LVAEVGIHNAKARAYSEIRLIGRTGLAHVNLSVGDAVPRADGVIKIVSYRAERLADLGRFANAGCWAGEIFSIGLETPLAGADVKATYGIGTGSSRPPRGVAPIMAT